MYLPMTATLLVCAALAQQTPTPEPKQEPGKEQLKVQVHMMNVCAPSDEDKQVIVAALAQVPAKPKFSPDFEISRGRTTFPDAPVSTWARIRREFPSASVLTSVQYSMSVDEKALIETLVWRARDPKDFLTITLEDRMSAVTTPAAALANDTPVSRIKIERFGKSSAGLARCETGNQSAFEPLFQSASRLMAGYRAALAVRSTVPAELSRAAGSKPAALSKPVPPKK
jgi:hypothetical protein